MKDISVVVPAYNAEMYLVKCLNSLVRQSKKDIEVIVVNDGSQDRTEEIARKYESKYPEIVRVISQENQGQSVARNNGIRAAEGKYIAFVDCDDYVDESMFEILYDKAIEADFDVVACNVNCVYPDKSVVIDSGVKCNSTALTKEDKRELLINMYTVVWNKIYKRELFENEELLFEPGLWFEDVLFLYKLVPFLNSVGFVDDVLYQYVQRANSLTYTYSDRLLDINRMLEKLVLFYDEKGLKEFAQEIEFIYARYMFATYIKRLAKSKDKKKFEEGVEFAKRSVKERFPNYKKNVYLRKGGKGFYIRFFNGWFARVVYFLEKNRMN